MAAGLPIRLNTAVRSVEQGAGRAVVTLADGSSMAVSGCIITASTNVLNSGAIKLGAGPARDLLDLVQDVPCGHS